MKTGTRDTKGTKKKTKIIKRTKTRMGYLKKTTPRQRSGRRKKTRANIVKKEVKKREECKDRDR